MKLNLVLAGSLLALLTACGAPSAQEQVDAAQAALNSGNFASARTLAEGALASEAVKADKALTWRLERLRLDALAGAREGALVLESVKRLETTNAAQVDAPLYATLTGKLNQAGDQLGAIELVHAGIVKFPEQKDRFEAELANLITAAAAAQEGGDNAAMERLRTLGYL